MITNETIIIIGAGASGLIAAKELAQNGKHIILLEAQDRLGGRMHTLYPENSSSPIEAGAEFVHGNLPVTLKLLKEYDLSFKKISGRMINTNSRDSRLRDNHENGWGEMIRRMEELEKDLTLSDFLTTYFHEDKYASLRKSAEGFANGFDLADPKTVSTFALRDEWDHEQEEQYRITGGYKKLVDALCKDCLDKGCEIHISEMAQKIEWRKDHVTVSTNTGKKFSGSKIIITVPAGVWHANKSAIQFEPRISEKIDAFQHIGFGSIIKIILLFKTPFWEKKYKNAGFIISQEQIPVWWSQLPAKSNLLTGWLGGVLAKQMKGKSIDAILDASLQSLANAFELELEYLKKILISSHIFNWDDDVFSRGGYSFSMIDSADTRQQLREPMENTLFFAGEALYDGLMPGTVEAAFQSGLDCCDKILSI
jgi:monoamine oxidase